MKRMTAKRKKWLTKICSDSQGSREDISISWSSPEESNCNVSMRWKKVKVTERSCVLKCEKWINNLNHPLIEPYSRGAKILHLALASVEADEVSHITKISSSSTTKIDSAESPIISGCNVEELSPVLTQHNQIVSENSSPILGKKKIFRKVNSNSNLSSGVTKHSSICVNTEENSPDIFPTQETQTIIIDSESPIKKASLESSVDTVAVSQGSVYKIDLLLSQDSSCSLINSDSNVTSSKSNECLIQHSRPPLKKKKFKRGGLCSQLQKVLRTQRSRVAIWQHEFYQGRLSDYVITQPEVLVHCFSIRKDWNEFGCNFFLCECFPECSGSNINYNKVNTSNSQLHTFVWCLGFNVAGKVAYKIDLKYILYPPYTQKIISYNDIDTVCFLNVSKIHKYKK